MSTTKESKTKDPSRKHQNSNLMMGMMNLAGVFVPRKVAIKRPDLPLTYRQAAALNAPCPCGSGRKYKKCCYAGRHLYQRP